ncbi:hypothetical protein EUX98_g159 [Antrodiella citrinella]|uniref:Uncharacterized protein n=1 Tax=Antrodiella citrinella TaxID=2447956 RepID=A0A4S4N7Z6_9APHY|nr:hypothetical protein EUX98_g159 [Antrodiella citrinella]
MWAFPSVLGWWFSAILVDPHTASMSDAAGFGSGGTTSIVSAGAALSGNSCNVTNPATGFFFDLNDSLNQCRPYSISGYGAAVQPVTITGIIPGGSAFQLRPPTGPTSFDWVANVAAGTSIVWLLTDSQGRSGGSSDVKLVGVSDDSTCLSNTSPASASITPSETTPASSSPSSPTSSQSSSPTSVPATGTHVGLIVGVLVAGVVIIAAAILVFLFLRRRRGNGRYARRVDLMGPPPGPDDDTSVPPINPYPFAMSTNGSSYAGTLAYGGVHVPSASSHNLLSSHGSDVNGALTNPFSSVYGGASITSESAPRQSYHDEPSIYSGPSGASARSPTGSFPPMPSFSSSTRKAAQAGALPYKPARFILHTDLEEAAPPDEGEEVIELPPQYSEARAPIATILPGIELTPATPSSPRPQQPLR